MLIYQDEAILVFNKPAGLRTIPDGYDKSLPHLWGNVMAEYGRVWVVHRLDKDTSGVILFARSAEAHRNLNQQFEQREIRKQYHVLAAGSADWQERDIALPLLVNGDRKHRTVVDDVRGKAAVTHCKIMQRFDAPVPLLLIEATPHSGYTHQIRVHLAAIGLPIVCDPLYPRRDAREENKWLHAMPIVRTALHAYQISIRHPVTSSPCTFTAPYPDDFEQTLTLLRSE